MEKMKYLIDLLDLEDELAVCWGENKPTRIHPVVIEKETPKSVWVHGGIRMLKKSNRHNFYDSFKEAKQALLEAQRTRIKQLQKTLERAESILDDIKGLSLNAK